MKFTLSILFCFLVLQVSALLINVPEDQPTIQAGINVAAVGDTVLVQPGTYVENINYDGKNITVASLFLPSQNPDYIENTIIDGNENGRVVTFYSEEDTTAVLCGFTIQNGTSSGIRCEGANPILKNLIVSNNSAQWWGGGISITMSEPILRDILIKNNSSVRYAGGISIGSSDPVLENVTISNNSAADGGGMSLSGYSQPNFSNVIINDNSAISDGGGLYMESSDSYLENLLIYNNSAADGGGICIHFSDITLKNVTICNNTANVAGALHMRGSQPIITNSILWDNSQYPIYIDHNEWNTSSVTFRYSAIHGGVNCVDEDGNGTAYWSAGSISSNPIFINAINDDYHLSQNSPCIDAGDPNTTLDPDGTRADMGFYYYHQQTDQEENDIPASQISLSNFPNPFNPTTEIRFQLSDIRIQNSAELEIYNVRGQMVKSFLIPASTISPITSVTWSGNDQNNNPVSSGLYFATLKAGDKILASRKMMLLK